MDNQNRTTVVVRDLLYRHHSIVGVENSTFSVADTTESTCRLEFDPRKSRDELTAIFACGKAQPIVRELKLDDMRLGLTKVSMVNDRENVVVIPCNDQNGHPLISMMVPVEGSIVMAFFPWIELERLITDAQVAAFAAVLEQCELDEMLCSDEDQAAVAIGVARASYQINGMIFGGDNPKDACLQSCLLSSDGTEVTLIFVNEGEDDDVLWVLEHEVFLAGLSQTAESDQDAITVSPSSQTFEGLPAVGITSVSKSEYGRKITTTVAFPLASLTAFADQILAAESLTVWPDWFHKM